MTVPDQDTLWAAFPWMARFPRANHAHLWSSPYGHSGKTEYCYRSRPDGSICRVTGRKCIQLLVNNCTNTIIVLINNRISTITNCTKLPSFFSWYDLELEWPCILSVIPFPEWKVMVSGQSLNALALKKNVRHQEIQLKNTYWLPVSLTVVQRKRKQTIFMEMQFFRTEQS